MDDVIAANRRLVTRYFEHAWNAGDVDVLHDLLAPDYVNHSPGMPTPEPGPAGLKPIIRAMRTGFPDLHFAIEDMVVAHDAVAVRSIMTGTHAGELFGAPPTKRRVRIAQMQIEHIAAGRIVAHWRQTDDLALHRQLGWIDG